MISIKIERTGKKEKKEQTPSEPIAEQTTETTESTKKSLFSRIKERFQGISLKESINTIKQKNTERRIKTYLVCSQDNPNDYEYIEAVSVEDAIEKSPYLDKKAVFANVKPEYNAYMIDEVVGCYPTYIEPKEINEKAADARLFYFDEYDCYMYFLYNKYNAERTESYYVAWERNAQPKITPDILYDAITWQDLIKEAFKPKELATLDKLNPALLLGLIGCLIFLIIILMG